MRIVELGKQFRPGTSHVYPPFKNGRYMEEYVYEYIHKNIALLESVSVYIPIFWTNMQNHPGFSKMRDKYNFLLQTVLKQYPNDTLFITVVQHDDGPQLDLPKNTIIYGACTGTIPLPLIYEDTTNRLMNIPRIVYRDILASFVGTYTTHSIREDMWKALNGKKGIVCHGRQIWSPYIPKDDATTFIELTLRSKFCLAPRGYGRSSFRFFEAILLDTIPVYIWDDMEWLPYKELLDYSAFSISIHKKDIPHLYTILESISDEKYESMLDELKKIKHFFTLDGLCHYVASNMAVNTQ